MRGCSTVFFRKCKKRSKQLWRGTANAADEVGDGAWPGYPRPLYDSPPGGFEEADCISGGDGAGGIRVGL